MSKRKKTPAYYTLLIPGIFMAVLGLGNILLGSFKFDQYQDTLVQNNHELEKYLNTTIDATAGATAGTKELSPLQRLKTTDKQSSRILALLRKAEARRDLYSLVIYGGKVFLLISALLLGAALIRKYFENNKQALG